MGNSGWDFCNKIKLEKKLKFDANQQVLWWPTAFWKRFLCDADCICNKWN